MLMKNANVNFVENKVVFAFNVTDDKNIMLEANNYQYKCHLGTSFEAQYERRDDSLIMPEELYFLTPQENEQLKAITGDRYQEFLAVAQWGRESILSEAGEELRIYDLCMQGYNNAALVVIRKSDGYMCAGLNYYNEADNRSEVHYFNDNQDALIWEFVTAWSLGNEIVIQN